MAWYDTYNLAKSVTPADDITTQGIHIYVLTGSTFDCRISFMLSEEEFSDFEPYTPNIIDAKVENVESVGVNLLKPLYFTDKSIKGIDIKNVRVQFTPSANMRNRLKSGQDIRSYIKES